MKIYNKVLSILIVFSAVVNLIVLSARIYSVIWDGRWGETTGMECIALNGIYNVRKALPCYPDLNQNASMPGYNYGFYLFYGITAKLVNVSDDQFMTFVRLLTLGCAVVGCAVMAFWIRRTIPNWRNSGRTGMILAISASVTICFGPFIGWWCLSARPDIAMAAAELAGLAFAVIAMKRKNIFLFICSAVTFGLAWSFKQNAVFVFGGILILLLLFHQWRFVLVGSLTFMSFVALIFALAGPFYVQHVFQLFSVFSYSLSSLIRELQPAFVTGFYVFVPSIWVAGLLLLQGRNELSFLLPWFLSGFGSVLSLVTEGSSRNYLFTFYFISAVGILYGISKILNGEISFQHKVRNLIALIIVLALGSGLTLSYLTFPNRFGRLTIPVFPGVNPSQLHMYLSAPKPKFIENPFYALPCNSGQAPSESIFVPYYLLLVKRGFFQETIEDRARRGYYASGFVSNPKFIEAFKSGEYDLVSLLPNGVWHFERAQNPAPK
jgi:hypothetical protein